MVLRKVCPTRCVCVGLKSDQRGIKVGFLPRKPTLMRRGSLFDAEGVMPLARGSMGRSADNFTVVARNRCDKKSCFAIGIRIARARVARWCFHP